MTPNANPPWPVAIKRIEACMRVTMHFQNGAKVEEKISLRHALAPKGLTLELGVERHVSGYPKGTRVLFERQVHDGRPVYYERRRELPEVSS